MLPPPVSFWNWYKFGNSDRPEQSLRGVAAIAKSRRALCSSPEAPMQMRFEGAKAGTAPADFTRPYLTCKPDDRRKHPRLECKGVAAIKFLDPEKSATGKLVDLSVAGCCIEFGEVLPDVRNLPVEVHLAVNGVKLRIPGVVRNVRRNRWAGIEFTGMSGRKIEQIKQLVRETAVRRLGC